MIEINLQEPLTYQYDETGGYDYMSPAFIIKSGNTQLFAIDLNDFGYNADIPFNTDLITYRLKVKDNVQAIVETIVDRYNEHNQIVEALTWSVGLIGAYRGGGIPMKITQEKFINAKNLLESLKKNLTKE